MTDPTEWVSLSEAASVLGVHPTTVRQWADNGDLPSQRTPGGHRRFRRSDLEQWSGREDAAPAEAQLMLQNALGRARIEVSGGQLAGIRWYDQLDEPSRQTHRLLGRRLLEALTHYLANPEEHDAMQEIMRKLGREYATLSRNQSLSLADSIRAFLFFRDLLIDSVIQLAELLSLRTPLDWGNRLRQVNHMTDELLLALVDSYHNNE